MRFSQTFRDLTPTLLKPFQKIAEEETFPNSFYKAITTLISKPDKDNTQKENYKPISLRNVGVKIPNTILQNKIQQQHQKVHIS